MYVFSNLAKLVKFAQYSSDMGKFRNLWNRSDDGDRREQRSFARYAIVATSLCLFFLLVKHDNLIVWVRSAITLRKQERQIEKLQNDNARLHNAAYKLYSDKDSLETFARNNFMFCEPDEDIYIVGD